MHRSTTSILLSWLSFTRRALVPIVLAAAAAGCKPQGAGTAAPAPAESPVAEVAAAPAQATARTFTTYPVDRVPAEWKDAVARGQQAMGVLQQTLFEKLNGAMTTQGAHGAITVCRDEAQKVSAEVAAKQDLELGRASHKLRNPKNAPRDWVEPLLRDAAGKKAAEVQPVAVDLGDRIGLVKPLGVQPLCVGCHGPADRIPADVQAVIAAAYPEDRAIGFAEGDFRGFIWAEVPKQ